MVRKSSPAFTLAELLITLAILGVIVTFTIPKIIAVNEDAKFNSIAKETIGMISGAYQAYKLNNTPDASTSSSALTPYMNYLKTDQSGAVIDSRQNAGSTTCNSGSQCIRLHNGAVLQYSNFVTFSGTNSTNAIYFLIDPDGVYSNTTTDRKSLSVWLYYNGKVRTLGTIDNGTVVAGGSNNACPTCDPPWFSWNN